MEISNENNIVGRYGWTVRSDLQRPQRLNHHSSPRRMHVTPITIRAGPPSGPRETPTPFHSSLPFYFFFFSVSFLFSAASVSSRSFAALMQLIGRSTPANGLFPSMQYLCIQRLTRRRHEQRQPFGSGLSTIYHSTPSLFNPFQPRFSLRLIADVTFPDFYFYHHPCGKPIKGSTSSREPT